MWWLSTRNILRPGNPEWDAYFANHPFRQVLELRTIDGWFNRAVDGNYALATLDDLPDVLDMLPTPVLTEQYYCLFADALTTPMPADQTGLQLLGYDLSDETWTSSVTNCGIWVGQLETVARRVNQYGLLGFEDAQLAQALLPKAWPGDPHGIVTVWVLFELLSGG